MTYLCLKMRRNGTGVLANILPPNVRFFSRLPSADRALTLSQTDGQQPRGPINRIAAHLTGNSNRKNSLSPRGKEIPLKTVKDGRNYSLVASLVLTYTF